MFKKNEMEQMKEGVKEFFQKMGFDIEVNLSSQNDTLAINLKSEEPQVLIGEGGRILADLQKILKAILSRILKRSFYIDLDINDYKKKKGQYLREMARKTADEVALNKKEKILPVMSSYERRIIHLELAERKDITTQSIGQEPERRIVIRPYP